MKYRPGIGEMVGYAAHVVAEAGVLSYLAVLLHSEALQLVVGKLHSAMRSNGQPLARC